MPLVIYPHIKPTYKRNPSRVACTVYCKKKVFLAPFLWCLYCFFQENKFTKCGVCVALKLCLQGMTNKEKRMTFASKRRKHNEQQM